MVMDKQSTVQHSVPTGTSHAVSVLPRPATDGAATPADFGMVNAASGDVAATQYTTRANNARTPDAGSLRIPLQEGRDMLAVGFHAARFSGGAWSTALGDSCTVDIWIEVEHLRANSAECVEYEYIGKLTLGVGATQVVAGTLAAPDQARLCAILSPATVDASKSPGLRISGSATGCRSWAKFDHEGATAVVLAFGARSNANLHVGAVVKQV
jgi:hypothetical protein